MKISTHGPHAHEPSASELDSTLKFNEVCVCIQSQRLSSDDQIRTNIYVDWDWVLSISTQKFTTTLLVQGISGD